MDLPTISVIIPTFQRSGALARTLDALSLIDYPRDQLEVIVVDDGSTDGTPALVARYPEVRYVRQPNAGVAVARNHGARLATGHLLLFIDDDIVVAPDNLHRHLAVREAYEECVAAGVAEFDAALRARLQQSPFGRFRLWAEDVFQEDAAARWGTQGRVEPLGVPTQDLSISRELFWSIGGFDERFPVGAEDQDLCWRARAAGARIVQDHDVRVIHNDQHGDLLALCKREERGAVGIVYMSRKHPDFPAPTSLELNGPLRRSDPPRLILRKLLRAALARPSSLALAHGAVRVTEQLRPGGGWPLPSLYRAVTGLYVFRGMRRGLELTSGPSWASGHRAIGAAADRGRIRVTHFISNSHPAGYFPLIARHTDHERFAMEVGSLDGAGGLQLLLEEQGVPTFALGVERRSLYPLAAVRLAARLRRERTDVLHTHLFEASLVGLIAAKLARTKLAIFTGHHSHEVPLHNRRLLFELDRFAAVVLADVVIAPSREMANTFVEVYGCRPDRVEVIEHGVDLTRFDPGGVDGTAVRAELGLEGKLVIGAVSKHFWVKNLTALVEAFAAIAESKPDAHLVIIGIGDSSGLAETVAELGLQARVSLPAPRTDMPEVFASFDVFVHPALAESFGLALVEAMAMELPVVATPVGIGREVIEDGVTGFRICGTASADIRDAIDRALESRSGWWQVGRAARAQALRFTPERWVRAHEELYRLRLGRPDDSRTDL